MPIYKVDGIKKDGLQKYKVRVNYISDDGTPKQLTRTAYGSEAAKDLERQLNKEIKTKGENSIKNLTVQELFEKCAVAKKFEIREITLDKLTRRYNIYIKPTMANIRIDRLNAATLQEWKQTIEEKGLSLSTRKSAYSVFRLILNFAVKMEYLERNPLLKVGNFKDTVTVKKEMSIYTADQFTKFIGTARKQALICEMKDRSLSEWEYYVFFAIAFYTGLRKGEIHALRWSDTTDTLLHVKRSITQKLRGEDRETAPKNSSSIRVLQIPLPLIKILKEHKIRKEKQEHFSIEHRICGTDERCLRDSTIQNRNNYYAELSGLDSIRIHDFRHSHVSVLANEGINIQEIARRLGHARVEMTWNTYSHLYPREEERAVDVLNKIA